MFVNRILFSDEALFRSDGITNVHNEHHYAVDNPHCTKVDHFQGRWSVAVWGGVLGDRLIGPHFFQGNVTGPVYADFLENTLPILLEDVPLDERARMWFMQDGHPAHR